MELMGHGSGLDVPHPTHRRTRFWRTAAMTFFLFLHPLVRAIPPKPASPFFLSIWSPIDSPARPLLPDPSKYAFCVGRHGCAYAVHTASSSNSLTASALEPSCHERKLPSSGYESQDDQATSLRDSYMYSCEFISQPSGRIYLVLKQMICAGYAGDRIGLDDCCKTLEPP